MQKYFFKTKLTFVVLLFSLQPCLTFFAFIFVQITKEAFAYVEENPVEELYVCPICCEPLVDPVIEPHCLQMFCRYCLDMCLRRSSCCPHCRQPASMLSVTLPPRFVLNLLGALLVMCPVCQSPMERSTLKDHMLKCPIRKCPPHLTESINIFNKQQKHASWDVERKCHQLKSKPTKKSVKPKRWLALLSMWDALRLSLESSWMTMLRLVNWFPNGLFSCNCKPWQGRLINLKERINSLETRTESLQILQHTRS